MGMFFRLALLALPLAGRVLCSEPPSQTPEPTPIYANAQDSFRDLLNALPEESLHAALSSLTRFRAGVFESGRHGVERVHDENPPLASRLIVAAVEDLKRSMNLNKRQASNGTTAATTQTPEPSRSASETSSQEPSSSSPQPGPSSTSSKPPAALIPITLTTTNSEGKETKIPTAILSEVTASVVITTTEVNSEGKTEVATRTKPAIIHETTDSAGVTIKSTAAADLVPTLGQLITTTDEKGSTLYTTFTPDGGSVQSIQLITTTGADGRPSTITSTTYVNPEMAYTSGTPTQTEQPGLQSGAAGKNRAMGAAVVGGFGGVVAMLI